MAGDAKKLQPIIVKKVKKGGHGAHGGAWKIAYADFVTAMMAFCLLMWLLGSTTEGDKKGEQRRAEQERLEELRNTIQAKMQGSDKFKAISSQVRLDMTRDGLRIQIVDDQNRPMFDSGSAVVKPYMRELLRAIGELLGEVPNLLTLEGHTDATPFPGGERGYSNWELSADRANASRRELMAGGLDERRILRVTGLASSQLFERENPTHPSNRRISIIVMNREAEDRVFKPVGDASESGAESGTDSASTPPAKDR